MATSRHKHSLDKQRRGLLEELVSNLTDLSRGSSNFKKAVDFAVANINDHRFIVPAPSLVKGQFTRLLEKLELHSQVSKHAALSRAFSNLQGRKFIRNQWEQEEILYSKLSLVYHLADRVLEYTPACEIQLRLFHSQVKGGGAVVDTMVDIHAEQLRAIASEFAEDTYTEGSEEDSDTDDEYLTYEENVQARTPSILDELRKEARGDSNHDLPFFAHIDGEEAAESEAPTPLLPKQKASLAPPPLGIALPPQLRRKSQSIHVGSDACSLIAFSEEIEGRGECWAQQPPAEIAHECTVVREVLVMLSGLSGRLFRIEEGDAPKKGAPSPFAPPRTTSFALHSPVAVLHLSTSSLKRFLDTFSEAGTDLLRLRRLAAGMTARGSASTVPRTLQALFSSVSEHLAALDLFLHTLIQGCDKSTFVLPDGSESRLSLLALENILRPRLQVLRVICAVAATVIHPLQDKASPGQLAQHALETLRQAASASQTTPDALPGRVLRRLYVAAMAPYVSFLEAWLFEGSLQQDTLGEFFISTVERPQDRGSEAEDSALDPMSAAASAYWQHFDMRDGGTVVHVGALRTANRSQLLLDSAASTIDEFYTGMTVHVQLSDKRTLRSVIIAYKGAKRKAEVALDSLPAANDKFIISTVAPLFLQPLASQILIAGKSLNVLLLDPETRTELREILCERPALVSSFRDRMREINAFSTLNIIDHVGNAVGSGQWPEWIGEVRAETGSRSRADHGPDDALATQAVSPETDAQRAEDEDRLRADANTTAGAASSTLVLSLSDREFGDLKLLGSRLETRLLGEMFEVGKGAGDRGGGHNIPWIFRSRHARGLAGSSLRSLFPGPPRTASPHSPATKGREQSPDRNRSGTAPDRSGQEQEGSGKQVGRSGMEVPMRLETVPFGLLVERGFMQGVEARVKRLNLALVTHLRGRFRLHTHLAALRRVFFMAAGDVLHVFALSLFEKLDSKQAWNDGHSLNTTLQSSLPPIPGVEYGTVTAYTAEVHQAQRVQLRKGEDTSITALDGLRLNYSVGWPLNLVIHDRTLGIYNDILVFLLQIKRAKCALDKDFKDEKHAVSSTGSADGAAPRRKSTAWISAPNPRHILLRLELRHVVNNVENYIMTQIHGEATKELERDIAAASNLDQVIATHVKFLHKMRDRCLLHERAAVVADTIRKILDLALHFQVAYPQYQRMRVLALVGDTRLDKHNKLRVLEEELQTIASDFRRCTRLLIVVLEKIVSRGFHPHLEDLLVRLSFNGYYSSSVPSEARR